MSNLVPLPAVGQSLQVPAHLAAMQQQLAAFNNAAAAGISGGSHPKISIKAARWRLQDANGNEEVVQQYHLDVVVVVANPNASKIWYAGAYDPNAAEPGAPDCFSDNGVGPSSRATSPQSPTCAACPRNVWGSKVTDAGKELKDCGDSKKIGVFLANELHRPTYELKIPAASMKNWKAMVDNLTRQGIGLPMVVVRMTFDDAVSHPQIKFEAIAMINEALLGEVQKRMSDPSTNQLVGLDDVARDANLALPAPGTAPAPAARGRGGRRAASPTPPASNGVPPGAQVQNGHYLDTATNTWVKIPEPAPVAPPPPPPVMAAPPPPPPPAAPPAFVVPAGAQVQNGHYLDTATNSWVKIPEQVAPPPSPPPPAPVAAVAPPPPPIVTPAVAGDANLDAKLAAALGMTLPQ